MKAERRSMGRISEADLELLREEMLSAGYRSANELQREAVALAALARDRRRAARLVKEFPAVWRLIRDEGTGKATPKPETTGELKSHERPKSKWPHTQDISLCLCEPEHRALFYELRRFGKTNIAVVAHWLLLLALAHPVEMDRLGEKIVRYAEAEGLNQFDHLRSLVAQTKGGRRGKLALVK